MNNTRVLEFSEAQSLTVAGSLGMALLMIFEKNIPKHKLVAKKITAVKAAILDLYKGTGQKLHIDISELIFKTWDSTMKQISEEDDYVKCEKCSGSGFKLFDAEFYACVNCGTLTPIVLDEIIEPKIYKENDEMSKIKCKINECDKLAQKEGMCKAHFTQKYSTKIEPVTASLDDILIADFEAILEKDKLQREEHNQIEIESYILSLKQNSEDIYNSRKQIFMDKLAKCTSNIEKYRVMAEIV